MISRLEGLAKWGRLYEDILKSLCEDFLKTCWRLAEDSMKTLCQRVSGEGPNECHRLAAGRWISFWRSPVDDFVVKKELQKKPIEMLSSFIVCMSRSRGNSPFSWNQVASKLWNPMESEL